jgi:hypothetical protein
MTVVTPIERVERFTTIHEQPGDPSEVRSGRPSSAGALERRRRFRQETRTGVARVSLGDLRTQPSANRVESFGPGRQEMLQ